MPPLVLGACPAMDHSTVDSLSGVTYERRRYLHTQNTHISESRTEEGTAYTKYTYYLQVLPRLHKDTSGLRLLHPELALLGVPSADAAHTCLVDRVSDLLHSRPARHGNALLAGTIWVHPKVSLQAG